MPPGSAVPTSPHRRPPCPRPLPQPSTPDVARWRLAGRDAGHRGCRTGAAPVRGASGYGADAVWPGTRAHLSQAPRRGRRHRALWAVGGGRKGCRAAVPVPGLVTWVAQRASDPHLRHGDHDSSALSRVLSILPAPDTPERNKCPPRGGRQKSRPDTLASQENAFIPTCHWLGSAQGLLGRVVFIALEAGGTEFCIPRTRK